ncbi:MAG: hypothetical protein Ct9H300mP29_7280 [Candidatus Neomarinimicrobiota bacterium]|nr:MAG: hypothetical protein Ct9H300mP29_7280 [Candidatus Neomarinimicrobiota bacterium]
MERINKYLESRDLSKQAWDQSCEMLELSKNIFSQAIIYLREAQNIETLKKLKKRDKEINKFSTGGSPKSTHPLFRTVRKSRYSQWTNINQYGSRY